MPKNGVFNNNKFNEAQFNGVRVYTPGGIITGSGNILSISQAVGLDGAGNLLSVSQAVTQYNIGEGQLLSFTQGVLLQAAGNLLQFNQIVEQPLAPSLIPPYIKRNGFKPIFTMGAYVWPDNTIHDSFQITGNESDARSMTFTLLFRRYSPYGPINFEQFDGAPITLDIAFLNGSVERIFTGRINTVDIDLMNGTLKCTCDDVRRDLIINTYAYQTSTIGYYIEDVSGKSTDTFDELTKRLETTPLTVDVNRYGVLTASNIMPAEAPHFTFTDSQVYGNNEAKGNPTVTKVQRSRIVNTVNIALTYQYQRRLYGEASYEWNWNSTICEFLLDGRSLANRATIQSSIQGTGWVLNPPGVTWVELPNNGLYNCGGAGDPPIAFSTVSTTSGVTMTDVKDANGNVVTGSDGNAVKKASGGTFTDYRDTFAKGAGWRMSYRWTQNVKETYNLTVTAPQSIAQYGVMTQSLSAGFDDSSDNSQWEANKTYKSPQLLGMTTTDGPISYQDVTPQKGQLNSIFALLYFKALTTIYKSHRDNQVSFSIPLNPYIEMSHTVYLNTNTLKAYGKVVSIEHNCDIPNGDAYTRVTIALSRALGTPVSNVAQLPRITPAVPANPGWVIKISSIYGDEPTGNFQGFVGNEWRTEQAVGSSGIRGTNTYKTKIQERFIVRSPEIGAQYRDLLNYQVAQTYQVGLPNHLLVASLL